MAQAMNKNESGAGLVVDMHKCLQHVGFQGIPDQHREDVSHVMKFVAAVAGLVQSRAMTPEQVTACELLDAGELKGAQVLATVLQNPFWVKQRGAVWNFAAHEAVAEPVMKAAAEVMRDAHSPPHVVADKWKLIRERAAGWMKCRPGSMDAIMESFVTRGTLDIESLSARTASQEVIDDISALRSNLHWASTFSESSARVRPLQAITARLDTLSQSRSSKVRLEAGNASIQELSKQLKAGENVTEESAKRVAAAYAGCVGLPIPEDSATAMRALLDHLATLDDVTISHCELGARLGDLLVGSSSGGGAQSPADTVDLRTDAWKKSLAGLKLVMSLNGGGSGEARHKKLVDALCEFQRHAQSTAVIEVTASVITPAVTAVREEIVKKRVEALDELVDIAKQKLADFAEFKGGMEGGASWKKGLRPSSTYDEVLRDAQYHLFKGAETGTSVTTILDKRYLELKNAWADMEAAASELRQMGGSEVNVPDDTLAKEKAKAVTEGFATSMEVRMLEAFALGGDKRQAKVKGCIASMGRHGISPDDLHPRIYEKALELKC